MTFIDMRNFRFNVSHLRYKNQQIFVDSILWRTRFSLRKVWQRILIRQLKEIASFLSDPFLLCFHCRETRYLGQTSERVEFRENGRQKTVKRKENYLDRVFILASMALWRMTILVRQAPISLVAPEQWKMRQISSGLGSKILYKVVIWSP